MKIPVFVAMAQWALLFALGFLVIVMYRHLGRVFGGGSPGGHDDSELGPPVGTMVPEFDYLRASDGSRQTFAPGHGAAALLAFVNPSCISCEQLVGAMSTANESGHLSTIRVLLLSSDPPSYLQTSEAFQTTRIELGQVINKETVTAYNAIATPLLVAIDAGGTVRASGPAIDGEGLLKFVRACTEQEVPQSAAAAAGH